MNLSINQSCYINSYPLTYKLFHLFWGYFLGYFISAVERNGSLALLTKGTVNLGSAEVGSHHVTPEQRLLDAIS
jgi:hypothetical protein